MLSHYNTEFKGKRWPRVLCDIREARYTCDIIWISNAALSYTIMPLCELIALYIYTRITLLSIIIQPTQIGI